MTAVQMTALCRRYAIEGKGYSTAGRITRVGGQADIPLDEFLVPMVLASDAVVRDGELIGDPTEGALVVLAAMSIVAAAEIRKALQRRSAAKAIRPASAPRAGATTAERPVDTERGRVHAMRQMAAVPKSPP